MEIGRIEDGRGEAHEDVEFFFGQLLDVAAEYLAARLDPVQLALHDPGRIGEQQQAVGEEKAESIFALVVGPQEVIEPGMGKRLELGTVQVEAAQLVILVVHFQGGEKMQFAHVVQVQERPLPGQAAQLVQPENGRRQPLVDGRRLGEFQIQFAAEKCFLGLGGDEIAVERLLEIAEQRGGVVHLHGQQRLFAVQQRGQPQYDRPQEFFHDSPPELARSSLMNVLAGRAWKRASRFSTSPRFFHFRFFIMRTSSLPAPASLRISRKAKYWRRKFSSPAGSFSGHPAARRIRRGHSRNSRNPRSAAGTGR